MPSFKDDQFYLLKLGNIFELQQSNTVDYSFHSIYEEISNYETWDQHIKGPISTETIDHTPNNCYTQYWLNCATNHKCADQDRYEFREICDYTFDDNETIYTRDFLNLY